MDKENLLKTIVDNLNETVDYYKGIPTDQSRTIAIVLAEVRNCILNAIPS